MASSNSGGTGFWGLLTITFIVLKILGIIHWSWVWVLAPLWAGTIFLLIVIVIAVLITRGGK